MLRNWCPSVRQEFRRRLLECILTWVACSVEPFRVHPAVDTQWKNVGLSSSVNFGTQYCWTAILGDVEQRQRSKSLASTVWFVLNAIQTNRLEKKVSNSSATSSTCASLVLGRDRERDLPRRRCGKVDRPLAACVCFDLQTFAQWFSLPHFLHTSPCAGHLSLVRWSRPQREQLLELPSSFFFFDFCIRTSWTPAILGACICAR